MPSIKELRDSEAPETGNAKARAVDQVRFVWSERRLLTRLVITVAVASAIVSLLLPKRFESTIRLIPSEPPSIGLSKLPGALAGLAGFAGVGGGLDTLGLKSQGARFVGMLHSRSVADRLLDRFDLMHLYQTKFREDARRKLDQRTIIVEDRKTGIISVTVQDSDPARASRIAQAYAEELDRLNADLNMSAAHRERVFLDQRLAEVRKDIDDSARRLAEFSSKNTMLSVDVQAKAMVEAAATLQGQIAAREAALAGMEQIYTANSPRVQAMRAQVEQLRRKLYEITGKEDGSSSSDVFPPIRQIPKLAVQYTDLLRENKVNNVVFEVITQQLETAKIEEAKELSTVKIMDPADIPERRVFPKRTMIVLISSAAAFVLGLMWIYARRNWQLTDPDDPVKRLLLEVSDRIPRRRFKVQSAGTDSHISG